ncbi:MAG: 4-hydroxy-tetrahydrodipicolinate reductase [Ignavibacteria bacterium]|nr:4-hydroxy-tetrahydrodipicolinate reductase [Ignavibacteria bacterium]
MNIALLGYGNMGKEVERVAQERNITIKQILKLANNLQGMGITAETMKDVDVCIDFSTPTAVIHNIWAVAEYGKNMVVGTTGWYDKLKEVEKIVKEKKIGLLYSPNFSLGINVFYHILTTAAHYFDKFDQYDVALRETHHRGKVDSPSGTALAMGQIVLQHIRRKKEMLHETAHKQIKPSQLHITSSRVGHVFGQHEVIFDSEADCVELVHVAKTRSGFALGALIAAEWLKGKKGMYTMKDVLTSM